MLNFPTQIDPLEVPAAGLAPFRKEAGEGLPHLQEGGCTSPGGFQQVCFSRAVLAWSSWATPGKGTQD